ncbi:hypothetical protein FQN54_008020 [Arachnomyces sp. PD_36]|nr:hypothetical protein FQN54_008020 [Arachnomyces sp. PD_36]
MRRDDSFYIPSPTVKLNELQSEPAQFICRVIYRVMSMTITRQTVAQIVDNMPIRGNYVGSNGIAMIEHPDIETRSQPSSDATKRASELCSDVDPMTLDVDLRAAGAFQELWEKNPQSVDAARRCLEIVSSVVHDITSKVYSDIHPHPATFEQPNKTPGCTKEVYRHTRECCPEYGRLHNSRYRWYWSFKHNSSSMVGYWAETMIFGGPVLFARGREGTECYAAFIHAPNLGIIQLTDDQIKSFCSLADAVEESSVSINETQPLVLPFTPANGAYRRSIEEAIAQFIYREDGQLDGMKRYHQRIGHIERRCGNARPSY